MQCLNPRPTAEQLASFYPESYYAYAPTVPARPRGLKALGQRLEWWTKMGLRRGFWGYPCPGGRLSRWGWRLLLWPLWMRMRWLGKDAKVVPYRGRGRFLDVGCGSGQELAYQRQFGLTASGVELSPAAARAAREQYGLDVRAGTLEEAGFPDRSFDAIHLSHVFEHLPNPAAALQEMARILDADGLVILKIPNAAGASAKRFGPYWLGWDAPRHLSHFEPATIRALLERHGFVIEQIRQDVGSWSFWRESRRVQARHEQGRELPDAWWRARRDRIAEGLACLRGQGSVLVVYARKRSSTPV